jgi:histidinol-phosphate/aromatic aminotransferase/cobyric acid decarboxylase-like protein
MERSRPLDPGTRVGPYVKEREPADPGWLDFTDNINPSGTPNEVLAAIAAARVHRYADLDTRAAEAHLASDAGVEPGSLLITAGATEAIRLAVLALGPPRNVVVVGPTYGDYARIARRANAELTVFTAEPPAFDPPWEQAVEWFQEHGGVLFICDPNFPTARSLGRNALKRLVEEVELPRGSRIVIDQSFAPFSRASLTPQECLETGSVVLIRSLSMSLAVPGLRLGYVLAKPTVIAALRAEQDAWSVGSVALAAAQSASWALSDESRARNASWRARLASGLILLGLQPKPSDTNFVLVHVGRAATALVDALAEMKIAVRSCAGIDLPEYIAIGVRPPADQDLLLSAIDRVRRFVTW